MGMRVGTRPQNRGFTLVEALAAATILAVSLMGLLSAWLFAFNQTATTRESADVTAIARAAIERQRELGYVYCRPEDAWFDGELRPLASASGARYQASTRIRSGRDPGIPDHLQLKQVMVTVTRLRDGAVVHEAHTYLAWGGV